MPGFAPATDQALEEYRRKRDFAKTPEPHAAGAAREDGDLVFVVQQHAARRMHWDLRLEVDGVLKSWPLPRGPSLDTRARRLAVMTEDHPFEYRDFEGVIPRGQYGAGQVIIWDEGLYSPDEGGVLSWGNRQEGSRRMREGLEKGKLSFTLRGSKLRGSFTLVRTKPGPRGEANWLLIKHRDEHASTRDVLLDDRSVRSGLTIQDIKEGRLPPANRDSRSDRRPQADPFPDPRGLRPMLATLVEEAFDQPGWVWEPKLDGVRVLAFVRDGEVQLRSRRGLDCTRQYPSIAGALERADALVLDGEVCALDEHGVPRFQLLQPRINLSRAADIRKAEAEVPVVYYVFDVLYAQGVDLRRRPLSQRKARLRELLPPGPLLRPVDDIAEYGRDVAAGARAVGFEGVLGKRAGSRYEAGIRSRSWVKVKFVDEQEFVVGGYTPGEGGRRATFGALVLGYYDAEGKLRHAGSVGSGFAEDELIRLSRALRVLEVGDCPFAAPLEGKVTWVRPDLVVQVKFSEWTDEGRLRAPVYLGRRPDADPRSVRREIPEKRPAVASEAGERQRGTGDAEDAVVASVLQQLATPKSAVTLDVGGNHIRLTNLDKVFWPAWGERGPLTKRDLVRYYAEVATWLLPHLSHRPLTLTRYPNGIHGGLFYQKHYAQPLPGFVETVDIWSSRNEGDGRYIMCNNLATLLWLAQLADLEIHAWMSRLDAGTDASGRPLASSGSEAALDLSVLNFPDYMVFDLDPYIYAGHERPGQEPEFSRRGWEKTVEVALALKDVLDQLRLSSFVKTTGKTGIHVYAPILRDNDYDDVRAATQAIGRFLAQRLPRDLTMEWDTSKRTGKVFFDYNQNTRGKTLAAQYSPRPTPWAGVSTPLLWSELPAADPQALHLLSVPARLAAKGDPWADILARKSDLGAAMGVT